jgi:hypothetical protein
MKTTITLVALLVTLSWLPASAGTVLPTADATAAYDAPQTPAATDALRAIVKTYLEVQAALTKDKFEDLKGPAATLSSQAAALGKDGADLAKAATAFAGAKDLAQARDAFGPLSDALIARVKADGNKSLASDLRVGFCPMNRKSWLQREETARNPYYGTTMLTCGSVTPVSASPAK